MTWYAKPRGAYDPTSTEGTSNIWESYYALTRYGFTEQAVCGIMGNAINEGGLNPWRWQGDTVNYNMGYGLFQFTPATPYVTRANSLSNLSVTTVTANASPLDGADEIKYFAEDLLGKWTTYCWRDYWDIPTYFDLYQLRQEILQKYGSNNRITLEQFKKVDNIYDATFCFLACYEGPSVPNLADRVLSAYQVNDILGGDPPIPPTPTKKRKMPLYMMIRRF